MLLHPFRALHPAPGLAADVASPPYDVIDTSEARELAAGRPHSFLHVVRPEIDLPPETDAYDDVVYAKGAENLRALVDEGVLVRDDGPALWLYRLDMGDQTQAGFVGCAEVADYEAGRIKRHEFTRKAKEDDRTRHVDTLGAQTGPVFLTYRAPDGVRALQGRLMIGEPDMDITAHDGVRHRLWRVGSEGDLRAVAQLLEGVDAFYIADGHHRAASAARVRDLRRALTPGAPLDAPFERFLVVAFPSDQLQILPYNRVVADLDDWTADTFLDALSPAFYLQPGEHHGTPPGRHRFGLYVDGTWHQIEAWSGIVDEKDTVQRLDVSILQDYLLAPILAIDDPRTSTRIAFVGGIRGTEELERRVDQAGTGCAFAMHPTSIEELLTVADAGLVMPPKSTWFEPKLASGLLVHPLD